MAADKRMTTIPNAAGTNNIKLFFLFLNSVLISLFFLCFEKQT